MIATSLPAISSCGHALDIDEHSWGELTDSTPLRNDMPALWQRMADEGHLFFRGFFPRDLILEARMSLLERLAQNEGVFDPEHPLSDGVLLTEVKAPIGFTPEVALGNTAIQRVVFGPEIKEFYTRFLGGMIRHFDYIWVRSMGSGHGTKPHCDIVYMGRGTHELYTAWIPYGDVTYDIGGLMILEKSHLQSARIDKYLKSDVDTFCENNPERHGWKFGGALSTNPASLRQKFGGRWLSAEFRMGDLLTFRMNTVHASLDNHSNRIRLSTDTRYQLASEPVDERWVGENPIAHGPAGRRGMIC
jgi:hypothetical protein